MPHPSDSDLAALLPDPPPPRPDRRDAAIAAAMRRFDGIDAIERRQPSARRRWWANLGRPQIGALVTAALVAAIGLPVWLESGRRPATVNSGRPTNAVQNRAAADSMEDAVAAPDAAATSAPTLVPLVPVAVPEPAPDRPEALSRPGPILKSQAGQSDSPAPAAAQMKLERAPVEARRADVAARPSAPAGVVAPPLPPPPPPPAPAMVADAADASNIVVTGSRISAPSRAATRRGDWNACTVNDPGRSLTACRAQVRSSAAGADGRAAAFVGDGLTRAWQGDPDGAITAFDRAIGIAPRLASAYLNRGLAYAAAGDTDRAVADLDRAVRLAPNAARGYYNRSLLLRRRGDTRRAEADEARAVDIDPRYDAVVK